MRQLAQTTVLKSAATAALVTTLLCFPRLVNWLQRPQPVWYLASILFLGTTVLWGWVFAWHTHYSQRPVFRPPLEAKTWILASLLALLVAASLLLWLDPALRRFTPEDYPVNVEQWLAMTLFHLSFTQLFLVYAPLAWSLRLFRDWKAAGIFTVLFGVAVLLLQIHASPSPLPDSLIVILLWLRILFGLLSVSLYLHGGVFLLSWCSLLIEARHLVNLENPSFEHR